MRTTYTVSVKIPRTEGVSLHAATAFGGMHNHLIASSDESALAVKQALAHWLAAVTEAVEKELTS